MPVTLGDTKSLLKGRLGIQPGLPMDGKGSEII